MDFVFISLDVMAPGILAMQEVDMNTPPIEYSDGILNMALVYLLRLLAIPSISSEVWTVFEFSS